MKKVVIGKINNGKIETPNKTEFEKILKQYSGGWIEMRFTKEKPRTGTQNNAIHLFCQKLADVLNDAGLYQNVILKPTYQLEWDLDSVKKHLWKVFQKELTGKESTTDLESQGEIEKIHKVLMRELGEKKGVPYIPFPAQCKSCGCLSGQGDNGSDHFEGCEDQLSTINKKYNDTKRTSQKNPGRKSSNKK